MPRPFAPYAERRDTHTDTSDPDACWMWGAGTNPAGYGRLCYFGSAQLAHRVAYIEARGPIPDGMTVDHTCFTRSCVNPAHLRLLTPSENSRNQQSALRTHCDKGHEFTPENTHRPAPPAKGRRCRICIRQRAARNDRRRRAARRLAA